MRICLGQCRHWCLAPQGKKDPQWASIYPVAPFLDSPQSCSHGGCVEEGIRRGKVLLLFWATPRGQILINNQSMLVGWGLILFGRFELPRLPETQFEAIAKAIQNKTDSWLVGMPGQFMSKYIRVQWTNGRDRGRDNNRRWKRNKRKGKEAVGKKGGGGVGHDSPTPTRQHKRPRKEL